MDPLPLRRRGSAFAIGRRRQPVRLTWGDDRLAWLTTIASFGGTVDVTTQEVVVESLVAADEATRRFALGFLDGEPATG